VIAVSVTCTSNRSGERDGASSWKSDKQNFNECNSSKTFALDFY
jgi:hypothetical protein